MAILIYVVFAMAVAVWDLSTRTIPKYAVMSGFVVGLWLQVEAGQWKSCLLAVCVASVCAVTLFRAGAFGGGDAKLLIAMAALLGLKAWMVALAITFAAAALMGILQALMAGKIIAMGRNFLILLKHVATYGFVPHPQLSAKQSSALRSPFGVAAAFGIVGWVLVSRSASHGSLFQP